MNNSKQSLSNLQKSYDDSHYTSKNNFYSSQNAGFRFPEEELKEELDEDDEWTAILKFNTLLHYEE